MSPATRQRSDVRNNDVGTVNVERVAPAIGVVPRSQRTTARPAGREGRRQASQHATGHGDARGPARPRVGQRAGGQPDPAGSEPPRGHRRTRRRQSRAERRHAADRQLPRHRPAAAGCPGDRLGLPGPRPVRLPADDGTGVRPRHLWEEPVLARRAQPDRIAEPRPGPPGPRLHPRHPPRAAIHAVTTVPPASPDRRVGPRRDHGQRGGGRRSRGVASGDPDLPRPAVTLGIPAVQDRDALVPRPPPLQTGRVDPRGDGDGRRGPPARAEFAGREPASGPRPCTSSRRGLGWPAATAPEHVAAAGSPIARWLPATGSRPGGRGNDAGRRTDSPAHDPRRPPGSRPLRPHPPSTRGPARPTTAHRRRRTTPRRRAAGRPTPLSLRTSR